MDQRSDHKESNLTNKKIGGPCQTCGLPQVVRAKECAQSRQKCPYGKFDESPPAPLLPPGNEFASHLGALAGILVRMEIAINKLDQRVRRLEGDPR